MTSTLERWLSQGDAPEADWGGHVLRLALKGNLGHAGSSLLLDLPALARPFACRPATCSPGRRPARTRSCCADVAVALTDEERASITGALDAIEAWQRPRDVRWEDARPAPFDGDELARPGGRCVFAHPSRSGLRCALHELEDATDRPRGTLKPMPCRLFPLVVADLGDGRLLLTAASSATTRKVGLPPARSFPCLREPGRARALLLDQRETIEQLWGADVYAEARRAVLGWRRRQA